MDISISIGTVNSLNLSNPENTIPPFSNVAHSATYTFGDMPIYSEPIFGIDELWPTITIVSTSVLLATVTPLGIPGKPVIYGYDLAGVYAILPDPKKRFKYIDIKFTFKGDKYEYQIYKEKQISVSINNIKRTPKWFIKPKVSLKNIEGLVAWKN
jgi:hypothetical protein